MARALMSDPTMVMLDEPMAGREPGAHRAVAARHIKSLRDEGMTVLFVEHDMDIVRDIADWVVVMAEGRVSPRAARGASSANKAVVDAYLGAHHDQALEFDAEGNPVGQTAVLVAEIESELEAAIERGQDLSA